MPIISFPINAPPLEKSNQEYFPEIRLRFHLDSLNRVSSLARGGDTAQTWAWPQNSRRMRVPISISNLSMNTSICCTFARILKMVLHALGRALYYILFQ